MRQFVKDYWPLIFIGAHLAFCVYSEVRLAWWLDKEERRFYAAFFPQRGVHLG